MAEKPYTPCGREILRSLYFPYTQITAILRAVKPVRDHDRLRVASDVSTHPHRPKSAAFNLLSAILLNGIRDYCNPKHRETSYEFRHARHWIFSPDSQSPTSFVRLCEALDLEPKHIRRVLVEYRRKPRGKIVQLLLQSASRFEEDAD
jgi:hypothetical protein